jgi:hypothetical protein
MAWPNRIACVTGVALLVATQALAQGRVTGTVKDPDDRPIRGATITAENPNAAPSTFVSTTDDKGRFAILGLRAGQWTFTAQAPGFETARGRTTTRTTGPNSPVDFVLMRVREIAPPGPLATVDVPALQRKLDEAAALDAAGKLDESIGRYRDILTQLPVLTAIRLQLGSLYERKHDTSAATAEYQAILKTDPGNTKARAALDRLVRQ